jgi:hypothetical protein
MNSLKEHLNDFGNELSIQILQKLEKEGLLLSKQQTVSNGGRGEGHHDGNGAISGETTANLPTYFYRVKGSECTMWDVPLDYCFPQKISRENGWQAWVLGFPAHQAKGADGSLIPAPIRPIRSIRPHFLPTKKLKDDLKTQWKPVFAMMEEGISLLEGDDSNKLPKNASGCSEALVSRLYSVGTEYLMRRASYIWASPKSRPESWAISHWSKKLSRSQIEKFGSADDKKNLPPPTKSNRSHPFFSRLIVGQGGVNSPRKRRQPEPVADDAAAADPPITILLPPPPTSPKRSDSREETYVLGGDKKKEDEATTTNKKQKHQQKGPPVSYLGIGDSRSINEIAFKVADSSIPDSEYYRLLSRTHKSEIPTLDIRRVNLENLKSQGKMLDSFVVTAYFKTLGRQYYADGVRVVDDTFMKWLEMGDSREQMMKRYKLAQIDSAKILLIPIFQGSVNSGHFSLVVVDRLTSILAYYGSFSSIDEAVCNKVLERLVRNRFAEKSMAVQKNIAGGPTGMMQQGANTNDCGAFTCCLASAHVKEAMNHRRPSGSSSFLNAPSRETKQQLQAERNEQAVVATTTTTKVRLTMNCPILWGKYARHHIGEVLRKGEIDMDDQALSSISVELFNV